MIGKVATADRPFEMQNVRPTSPSELPVPGSGETLGAPPAFRISRSSDSVGPPPEANETLNSTPAVRGVAAYRKVMESLSATAPTDG